MLTLKNVDYSDTAVFQCKATNKHGSIVANTYVYVIGEGVCLLACLRRRSAPPSICAWGRFALLIFISSSTSQLGCGCPLRIVA